MIWSDELFGFECITLSGTSFVLSFAFFYLVQYDNVLLIFSMKLNTSVPSSNDPSPTFSSPSSLMFSGLFFFLNVSSYWELSSLCLVWLIAVFDAEPKLSSTTVLALYNVSALSEALRFCNEFSDDCIAFSVAIF